MAFTAIYFRIIRWGAIVPVLLLSCQVAVIQNRHTAMMAMKNDIPPQWLDEDIIVLKDSTAYTIKTAGNRISLKVTAKEWYYVNKQESGALKTLYIYFSKLVQLRPEGTVTVFRPDGTEQHILVSNQKEYHATEPGIHRTGGTCLKIPISGYTRGMVICQELTHVFTTPEVVYTEQIRGRNPCLDRKVTFTVPAKSGITRGLLNKECLPVAATAAIDGSDTTVTIAARMVEKIDPGIYIQNPEAWYAGYWFSLPPRGSRSFTWNEMGDYRLSQMRDALVTSPEIQALAKLLQGTEPDTVIEQAFTLLQDRVRYHADEEGVYGFIPRPASEIFAQGYGDCKEKSVLFKMLLQEKGIRVNCALIRARKGRLQVTEAYPTLGGFDHMICYRKTKDGRCRFYDPTAYFSTARKSYLPLAGQTVFLLDSANSALSVVAEEADDGTVIRSTSRIVKQNAPGGWELHGKILLTGFAAWSYNWYLQEFKGETYRPQIKELLAQRFNIHTDNFTVTKQTMDSIRIEFSSGIGENYLTIDKGGFLINKPSLYAAQYRYPDDFTGPRHIERFVQYDFWEMPETFTELEKKDYSHAIGDIIWKKSGATVSRTARTMPEAEAKQEHEVIKQFLETRSARCSATVWKK